MKNIRHRQAAELVRQAMTRSFQAKIEKAVKPLEQARLTNLPDLARSARVGDVDHVKALLAAGADVNERVPKNIIDWDKTALMIASGHGHLGVVQVLLDAGANVQAQDRDIEDPDLPGSSALHYAAHAGHADIVLALIAAGAKVNLEADKGVTPLMDAAGGGHLEVVQVLLEAGADVRVYRTNAGNVLHEVLGLLRNFEEVIVNGRCVKRRKTSVVRVRKLIGILLNAGANPNHPWHYTKRTPLMDAVEAGDAPVVRLLAQCGADLNLKDYKGRTALDFALALRGKEIRDILKSAGAKRGKQID